MDKRARAYLRRMGVKAKVIDEWDVRLAQRDGRDVAVVITKGPEIHFVAIDGAAAMTRKNTLEFIAPILERHGYVTTRVPLDVTDHKLRNTLGFAPMWNDDRFTYWALTELPFQRRKSWTTNNASPAIS